MGQTPEGYHFNTFVLRDGELYYKNKGTPLMKEGRKLKSFGVIVETLSKNKLRDSGFIILESSEVTARQAIMLNRVE